jgi:hypothetical protein
LTNEKRGKQMRIIDIEKSGTQKARGLLAMAADGRLNMRHFKVYSLPLTAADTDKIFQYYGSAGEEIFVRPCPTKARHGFVDSRVVVTREDLETVQRETLAEDPNGELIIMSKVDCAASMIITPHAVAIGPGHDGATKGNNSLSIPLAHVSLDGLPIDASAVNCAPLVAAAGVDGCPYFEILSPEIAGSDALGPSVSWPLFVQLRNGPKPPPTFEGNWIPEDTVVRAFIFDTLSELDFEREIKTVVPGTVVMHRGGTTLSHYFAHASQHNVPVIFNDDAIEIGQTLKKTATNLPPNALGFTQGIEQGATIRLTDQPTARRMASFALTMIHNAHALKSDFNGARLLGCAVAVLARLSFAAILGEYRHVRKKKRERNHIYQETLESFSAFWKGRAEVTRAEKSFATSRRWRVGKFGGSYGGKKWAACATGAKSLERAIVQFLRSHNPDDIVTVIGEAHKVVNCSHNAGPFLSKFAPASVFDLAARGDISLTAESAFTGYRLWEMKRTHVSETALRKWATARINGNTVMLDKSPPKPTPHANMTLQFCWRGDDAHFQFGRASNYVSATISHASFLAGGESRALAAFKWLRFVCATTKPVSCSFSGGSNRPYWILATNAMKYVPQRWWNYLGAQIPLCSVLAENGINLGEIERGEHQWNSTQAAVESAEVSTHSFITDVGGMSVVIVDVAPRAAVVGGDK